MKYKQITRYTGDLLETILMGRGIDDIDLFLRPNNLNDTKLDLVTNIDKGVELVRNYIDKKIMILVDSDMDGFSSASIIYKYIKYVNRYARVDYYVHERKEHGLTNDVMSYIQDNDFDLIIIPDAGSNDVKQIEYIELVLGVKVLVIDHHEVEEDSEYGVIINNQTCEYTNKNLTGAGLTYVFCKALEKHFNTGMLENLSDLALIGLVGDSSDLRDNEVRNLCTTAIKNIESNLISTFYEVNGKAIDSLTIKDLSFGGIIPMVNSITRVGTLEERMLLFEALSDIDNSRYFEVTKRKLNKVTRKYEQKVFNMNLYEYVVDVGVAVKKRQDKLTKEYVSRLEKQYNQFSGVQIFVSDEGIGGISGLIANKLSEKYQQPVIVLRVGENNVYAGSIRGNVKVMDDFKKWCLDTQLFKMVKGHSNAAGCEIESVNVEKLREKAMEVKAREVCYEVDLICKGSMNPDDIRILDRYRHLWYGGVNPPTFAVEEIKIPKAWLNFSKSTLRFYCGGVSYVKFQTSEEEFRNLKLKGFGEYVTLNIVGKTEINRWNDRETPQFTIQDYEVVEEKTESIYGIFA